MNIRLPNALRAYIYYILTILIVFTPIVKSQNDTVIIATYNLLNYPGTNSTERNPEFRKVVHTMKPDVLIVQEMTSQAGVNTFLNEVMNKYQSGLYSTVAFNDGPDSDNSIFYRNDKFTFLGANYINTALRRIAEYTLLHKNSNEQIKMYSVHLKAASGAENESLRVAEARILRNHLNNLPPNTNFIVGGDFNIYGTFEAAYITLTTSQTNNNGRCVDPINAPGVWNQYQYRFIHTQSTRVRSFGGGATGGLDDRFDMMLHSTSLTDNIILSSYIPYGNDGNHFNDSINRLPNNAVPDSVANALHFTSDHLPVFARYVFPKLLQFSLISPFNGADYQSSTGTLVWQNSVGALGYDVYLSTSNPPTVLVSSNQTSTSYDYSALLDNTVYYWRIVARNTSATREAEGSPWSFRTYNVLAAPSNLAITNFSNKTISLSWIDNANNEIGYRIYRISPQNTINFNLSANSTTFTDTGLVPNTNYKYRVLAYNELGEGKYDSISSYTAASISEVKDNFAYGKSFIILSIDCKDNPTSTEHSIIVTEDTLVPKYVQLNGTLDLEPVWRSYQQWQTNPGILVNNLNPNTTYYVTVQARNFNNVLSDISSYIEVTTYEYSVSRIVDQGWNIVSMPVERSEKRKVTVFPYASSASFAYENSYVQKDTLKNGSGYWVKFSNFSTIEIGGVEKIIDTIFLHHGWNLIGSISFPVHIRNIVPSSPDLIVSPYWGYKGGYALVDSIKPSFGYWVKANGTGNLIIDTIQRFWKTNQTLSFDFDNLNKLTFGDNQGNQQSIYFSSNRMVEKIKLEMPPITPKATFDVRFVPSLLVEDFSDEADKQISINNSSGVIEIEWNIKDNKVYSISSGFGQKEIIIKEKGSITLNQPEINLILLKLLKSYQCLESELPKVSKLYQNYPNPFNPSTEIKFYLANPSQIRLFINNIIGEEIITLMQGVLEAGEHKTVWNATVPSGVYICRLIAVPLNNPQSSFNDVKKVLLLK